MEDQTTLIRHLLEQNRHAQALPLIQSELEHNPEDQVLRFWLASCFFYLDEDEQSEELLAQLLTESPQDEDFLLLKFRISFHLNKLPLAEEVILQLIHLRPETADFYALYALVMLNSFNLDKARSLAKEAARIQPELSPLTKLTQCMIQVIDGNTRGAEATIGELLREEPQDSVYLHQLGKVLLNRNKHRAALVIYESLVRYNPQSDYFRNVVIELRVLCHWTAIPLWPIHKFGSMGSIAIWLGFILILGLGRSTTIPGLEYIIFTYLAYVIYSWSHRPILRKILS